VLHRCVLTTGVGLSKADMLRRLACGAMAESRRSTVGDTQATATPRTAAGYEVSPSQSMASAPSQSRAGV